MDGNSALCLYKNVVYLHNEVQCTVQSLEVKYVAMNALQ